MVTPYRLHYLHYLISPSNLRKWAPLCHFMAWKKGGYWGPRTLLWTCHQVTYLKRDTPAREHGPPKAKGVSLTVLLPVCLSLQLKALIRERRGRNMHQKVRNSCAGEGTSCIWGSCKQLSVVRECRPIGNEKKKKGKKRNIKCFPNSKPGPSHCPRGSPEIPKGSRM